MMSKRDLELAIEKVPGARVVSLDVNTTLDEVDGQRPLSIAAVVHGGDDLEVAKAIYMDKPVMLEAVGEMSFTVGEHGNIVSFSRPDAAQIVDLERQMHEKYKLWKELAEGSVAGPITVSNVTDDEGWPALQVNSGNDGNSQADAGFFTIAREAVLELLGKAAELERLENAMYKAAELAWGDPDPRGKVDGNAAP